jgi:hypothetical protein
MPANARSRKQLAASQSQSYKQTLLRRLVAQSEKALVGTLLVTGAVFFQKDLEVGRVSTPGLGTKSGELERGITAVAVNVCGHGE